MFCMCLKKSNNKASKKDGTSGVKIEKKQGGPPQSMRSLNGSAKTHDDSDARKFSMQEEERRRQSSHFDNAYMNNNTQSETMMARNPTVQSAIVKVESGQRKGEEEEETKIDRGFDWMFDQKYVAAEREGSIQMRDCSPYTAEERALYVDQCTICQNYFS